MSCESILKKIRPFLDDLLEEEDYQEVCLHLRECVRCHQYATSIGSLSYRIDALGDVQVPPDLLSTVLYSLKKSAASDLSVAAPLPPRASSAPLWVLLSAAFLAGGVGAGLYFSSLKRSEPSISPKTAPVAVPLVADKHPESVPGKMQWHYHLSSSSREELLEIMSQMGLVAEYRTPQLLVLNVPRQALEEFVRRLSGLSGVLKEFGEMNIDAVTDDLVQVSVFLD